MNKCLKKANTVSKEVKPMKRKYCIGFFAAIFMIMILLEFGYRWSYQQKSDRQKENTTFLQEKTEPTEVLAVEGNVEKNSEYLLKELNGYVIVYLSDEKTVYEVTGISINELPKEVQSQIQEGIKFDSINELYAFLENYSS